MAEGLGPSKPQQPVEAFTRDDAGATSYPGLPGEIRSDVMHAPFLSPSLNILLWKRLPIFKQVIVLRTWRKDKCLPVL